MNIKNCYVVIWEDRHAETDVTVFADQDDAITWIKQEIESMFKSRPGYPIQEQTLTADMIKSRWCYWITYGTESAGAWVIEKPIYEKGSKP